MEEADLECNQMSYTKKMNRISDDTLWEAAYVDRAERMVRRDIEIIYVGKAISLKNRVRQYFQSSRNKGVKIEQMLSLIHI